MAGQYPNVATQFKPGNGGGPGRPMGIIRLIRRHVGADGEELVRFMLAVMRGEVDAIYPRRPPKPGQRRDAKHAVAPASRPRHVALRDRMAAANWLANRGFGKAPLVVKVDDDRPEPLDPSALTAEERASFRVMMAKMARLPVVVDGGRPAARLAPIGR